MKNTKKEFTGDKVISTATNLQEFAQEIIDLNRNYGVKEQDIASDYWMKGFHENCKTDVNPNTTFEECQRVVWNILANE